MVCTENIKRKLDSIGSATGTPAEVGEAFEKFKNDPDGLGAGRKPLNDEEAQHQLNQRAGMVFAEVFQYELDYLAYLPPSASQPNGAGPTSPPPQPGLHPDGTKSPALNEVIAAAHKAQLGGLALSGGGIRSATFNLGVLQALAKMKLLTEFHYLSTVSGGGYIGGWLSRWIAAEGGDVAKVQDKLGAPEKFAAPKAEPAEVQFLRRYSNYMTPKTGMFSADTWTLIATYFRNTLLNMTMLLAWLAALFLIPRVAVLIGQSTSALVASWAGAIFFLWAVGAMAYSISRKGGPGSAAGQSQEKVLWLICFPLMLAGALGCIALARTVKYLVDYWDGWPGGVSLFYLLAPGLCYITAWAIGWGVAQQRNAGQAYWKALFSKGDPDNLRREAAGHFFYAIGALAVGTILVLMTLNGLYGVTGIRTWPEGTQIYFATFGMPLLLLLFAVSITLMIGLIGRLYSDQSREWWARQGAWTTIFTAGWLFFFAATFFLPPLLHWAFDAYTTTTSIGAAFASLLTFFGLKSGSGSKTGSPGAPAKFDLLAQAAPYAFTVLVVAMITSALQFGIASPGDLKPKQGSEFQAPAHACNTCNNEPATKIPALREYIHAHIVKSENVKFGQFFMLLLGCSLSAVILSRRVDINKFSLYMMYRLRLVRAYFGASNKNRQPHAFTGFDPGDDPELSELLVQNNVGQPLQRPYHLINAALNLVNGKELAWQQRKAANFVFSPAYCGFEMPSMSSSADPGNTRPQQGAFRPTRQYASSSGGSGDADATVKLGMAVAVSGAAASPNMGYHSSPPLAFLMTLFNLRLGRWCPNPMKEKVWRRTGPSVGLGSILSELFGLTDAEADYLYLSDGGHFENLGIYELVRRRCRVIVAIDASCDVKQEFDDLGNAVRKCATDLNIPLELNAREIRSYGGEAKDGASCVIGKIRYSQADGAGAPDGVLLYIKPTIVGNENADIQNYSKMHPEFPHETTADQWFDENQFESYRALGFQIGLNALKTALEQMGFHRKESSM